MSTVSERDFGRLEAAVEKLEDQVENLTLAKTVIVPALSALMFPPIQAYSLNTRKDAA